MKISMRARDDILALFDQFKKIEKAEKGIEWADTSAVEAAVNDRNFIRILRDWDGGSGGPTMKRLARFEQWMRERIGEKLYDEFRRGRAEEVAAGKGSGRASKKTA